jgi:hypothetical protein
LADTAEVLACYPCEPVPGSAVQTNCRGTHDGKYTACMH